MAKFPTEYKAAAEAAQREIPTLKNRRASLMKQIEELDQEISFTENIISLWARMSGDVGLPPIEKDTKISEVPVYESIADVLRDGRTLQAKQIASIVSEQRKQAVSLATIYSALARKRDMFHKVGKGYRLKSQRDG